MLQRSRTSEALRERSGRLPVLALINMTPIPEVRHRTCQWVTAPGRPALMCGVPVAAGCSWCAAHAAIVFLKPYEEEADACLVPTTTRG